MAGEFLNEHDENSGNSNDYSNSLRGENVATNIWRTKSLDDAHPSLQSVTNAVVSVASATESARSLHSSFDAALLLDSNTRKGKWFDFSENMGQRGNLLMHANQVRKEFSGRKHMRQKFQVNAVEVSLAETLNKNISTSKLSEESNCQCHTSTRKGCSSVSKRRRIPTQSTRTPVEMFGARISNTHGKVVHRTRRATELSLSPKKMINRSWNLTPKIDRGVLSTTSFHPTGTTASKETSTGKQTVTTAALETTEDSYSCELSSPSVEPFQFTSFPDSLPRLNNPVERHYPERICRRMSFGGEKIGINASSQSREEDGTQNTSISSLSVEGCRHSPIESAPVNKETSLPSNDMLEPTVPSARYPNVEKLICPSDNNLYSPGSSVGGVRLDFNEHMDPTETIGNSAQTSFVLSPRNPSQLIQIHKFSLTRGLSSSPHKHSRFSSSFYDSEAPLTPDRSCVKPVPTTPRDVLLHFPSEAECSPILSSDHQEQKAQNASHADGSSAFSTSVIFKKASGIGVADEGLEQMEKDLSTSSARAKQQLRPMPDMSAFENTTTSSREDRSTDDSLIIDSKGFPTLPRRLCPPTPVRTPAWASDAGAFVSERQNSLISTKVLLACPSHILEGRNSLENSLLLEEDCDYGPLHPIRTPKQPERPTLASQDKSEVKRGSSQLYDDPIPIFRKDKNDNGLVSFNHDFEILSSLGSGAFADAFKVKSQMDGRLYAVKRNRRQFRGIRDRNMALAEVQHMHKLHNIDIASKDKNKASRNSGKSTYSLYLLFFYRAWQEDGYFFCQTELCCRDSCKELLDSIRLRWKSSSEKYPSLSRHILPSGNVLAAATGSCSLPHLPHDTVWKICHDIAAGLSHIHTHGLVHHDIKPSNILFVGNPRLGAMCKICDFGLAGEIGSSSDGQEGDTRYMPLEVLSSMTRQPSADIFSLGLTLYEIASDQPVELPSEGPLWHQLRSNSMPQLPEFRGLPLCQLIEEMTNPSPQKRPTADYVLSLDAVLSHGHQFDEFLQDYIFDVEKYDKLEEERYAGGDHEDQTPRNWAGRPRVTQSPGLSMLLSSGNNLLSPTVQ